MWGVSAVSNWYQKNVKSHVDPVLTTLNNFFRPLNKSEKSFNIHDDQTEIFTNMLQYIAFVLSANKLYQWSQYSDDSEEPSNWQFFTTWSFLLLSVTSRVLSYRKKMQMFAQKTTIEAAYPQILMDAAHDVAKERGYPEGEVPFALMPFEEVCKDCNLSRKAKGSSLSNLSYIFEWLLLDYGFLFVKGPMSLLYYPLMVLSTGRMTADNLLSVDLCPKHRDEYIHQHFTFLLKLGLEVEPAVMLTSYTMSALTGIDLSWYIRHLYIMLEVERYELKSIPKFDDKSVVPNLDPLLWGRFALRAYVNILLPGLKDSIREMLAKPGEPLPVLDWLKTFLKYYQNPNTKRILIILLPQMLTNPHDFVNDPVIKHHWEAIKDNILYYLNITKKIHTEYTTGTKGMLVDIASKVELSRAAAISMITDKLKISESLAGTLLDFALSEDFEKVYSYLRGILTQNLAIENTVLDNSKYAFFTGELIDKPEGYFNLVERTDNAISQYSSSLTSHDFGLHREGRRRADIYRALIAHGETSLQKQFICYCVLINSKGPTLKSKVEEKTTLDLDSDKKKLHDYLLKEFKHDSDDFDELVKELNALANSNPSSRIIEKDIISNSTAIAQKLNRMIARIANGFLATSLDEVDSYTMTSS